MKLTKHAHACITVEKDGTTLVVDPGVFTPDAAAAIATADAVLITHDHPDHIDVAALQAALEARPELLLFAPEIVVGILGEQGGRVRPVAAGDSFEIGAFSISAHGGTHAPIHQDMPEMVNVGYLFDDRLLHPGDAYLIPEVPVETLLLPISGPWYKTGEAVDYVRALKPSLTVPIHELLASELARPMAAQLLGEQGLTGIPLITLAPAESLTV